MTSYTAWAPKKANEPSHIIPVDDDLKSTGTKSARLYIFWHKLDDMVLDKRVTVSLSWWHGQSEQTDVLMHEVLPTTVQRRLRKLARRTDERMSVSIFSTFPGLRFYHDAVVVENELTGKRQRMHIDDAIDFLVQYEMDLESIHQLREEDLANA